MSSGTADDGHNLLAVKGIGRNVEARLNERGVSTLAQLTERSNAELASMLEGLKGGFTEHRIEAQKWQEQATALLASVPAAPTPRRIHPIVETARHNFTVEAQLDAASGSVIASQADHVQSHDRMAWKRWDPAAVVAFMEERMGVAAAESAPASARPGGTAAVSDRPPTGAPSVLHSFAMVPGNAVRCDYAGPVHATVSFDAAPLQLDPNEQNPSAHVQLFVRHAPVTKAVLVGQGVASFSPGASVDVDIACEIPSSGGQATMFATVHVYAATAQRPHVASLPGSRLALQPV